MDRVTIHVAVCMHLCQQGSEPGRYASISTMIDDVMASIRPFLSSGMWVWQNYKGARTFEILRIQPAQYLRYPSIKSLIPRPCSFLPLRNIPYTQSSCLLSHLSMSLVFGSFSPSTKCSCGCLRSLSWVLPATSSTSTVTLASTSSTKKSLYALCSPTLQLFALTYRTVLHERRILHSRHLPAVAEVVQGSTAGS